MILAIFFAAPLLVPAASDLSYQAYSINVLLAASASALLMAVLVLLFRSLPMIAAMFIGMAFATFVEIYFIKGFSILGTFIITVLLVTNLREGVIRFFAVFSIVFAILVVASHSDTLLSPPGPGWDTSIRAESNNRPAVIHIVLDQFMGPNGLRKAAGVPEVEVAKLEESFVRRGFRVFRNVRSVSGLTLLSFNNFLTGEDEANVTKLPPGANLPESNNYLNTNPYFDKYLNQHYMVHSVYSEHLRLCPSVVTEEVSCRVYYRLFRRGSLASRHSSREHSLWLFASALAFELNKRSSFYHLMSVCLNRLKGSPEAGISSGPVMLLELMDQLTREIKGAERGQLYFAHLLLPHAPFVLDESCQLGSNFAQKDAYWAQVKCTMSRLGAFFNAIEANPALNNAIILVHGDHGAQFDDSDLPEDLDEDGPRMLNHFNAFVAFRAPGYEPGVDDRRVALADVIRWELEAAGVDSTSSRERTFQSRR